MAVSLKHSFQCLLPDDPDTTVVRPSNWNDEHVLTAPLDEVIVGTGTGTASVPKSSLGSEAVAAHVALADPHPQYVLESTVSAFGASLIDDADAATARTTLGLGSLATQTGTFSGVSSGTNTGDQNLFRTIAVAGQSDVVADTTTDTLTLVAGTNITITTDAGTDAITINSTGGGGGVSDGDKGDIVVSGSGATWSIDSGVLSAFGRTLIDDADAATARATLELSTAQVIAADRTALKAIDTTKFTNVFLNEGYRKGVFIWTTGNYAARITADTEEGLYIKANAIASTAGAWVRQYDGLPSIDWFGAVPDNATNAATAVNAALALCTKVTASGDYAFTSTINLNNTHYSIDAPNAKFTNASAGLPLFTLDGWRGGTMKLRRIDNNSGAGHICTVNGIVRGFWWQVDEVYQNNAASSYWVCGDTDTEMYSSELYIPYYKTASGSGSPQPAAPMIEWSRAGISLVANKIYVGFGYGGSTNPLIRILNTSAGTYNTANYIEVRAAEICDAGIVHLAGMARSEVVAYAYDNTTTVDDMIKLYSSGGNRCLGIKLTYGRASGTIGGGLYDVKLTNAYDTQIWAPPLSGANPVTIDNNDMFGTVVYDSANFPAVISNETTRVARRNSRMVDDRPGATITIAAGVATLSEAFGMLAYRLLDTEGAAATDDLTSISGGFPGQRLTLKTVSSARDVVLVHSASIVLEGSANQTLSATDVPIELICTATNVWQQVSKRITPSLVAPIAVSASTNTAGLTVQGGTSVGTASASAGQILVGSDASFRGSIAYDFTGGDFYIDNTWNNDAGNIIFRTKTSGTPVNAITIGGAGDVTLVQPLKFTGTTSGVVTVQPAAVAGTWSMTLPTSAGSAGQVLQTDGAGITSWVAQSGGGGGGVSGGQSMALNYNRAWL